MTQWTMRQRLELRAGDARDWLARHALTGGDANAEGKG
jgi:hypothetical protein